MAAAWQEMQLWLQDNGIEPVGDARRTGTAVQTVARLRKTGHYVWAKGRTSFDPGSLAREAAVLQTLSTFPVKNICHCYLHQFFGRPSLHMLTVSEYATADLAAWFKRFSVAASLGPTIAFQLCHAVAHLHDLQIMHRDIKPSHLLLFYGEQLVLKLADFFKGKNIF